MSVTLKPYPTYKDSGVPWLMEVPEHWETAAVKRHYSIQLGKMLQSRPIGLNDEEVPYLKAQHVQWFAVRTSEAPRMWASPQDVKQFTISAGDLLVCEGGEGGRCGILREDVGPYIIQNALHRVRPLDQCQNEFLQYVMSTIAAIGWFDAINNKATIAHFTKEKFGALGIPIPTKEEQSAIVLFLDHYDRKIRRFIHAKQKLIKLLEEQKQAIISKAVTRGLDPNVRLKSSSVEWLGEVPEHWEIERLKWLMSNVAEQTAERKSSDLYVALEHVESWTGRLRQAGLDVSFDSQVKRFRFGDILFGKLRPYLAKVARPESDGVCVSEFLVLRPRVFNVTVPYMEQLLRSKPIIDIINSSTFGAKMPRADWQFIGGILISLPPLTEQAAIVKFLEKATSSIVTAINRAQNEITFIREYRTRLIADVVTGKLDVRNVPIEEPEEIEELPELEDVDDESSMSEEVGELEDADN